MSLCSPNDLQAAVSADWSLFQNAREAVIGWEGGEGRGLFEQEDWLGSWWCHLGSVHLTLYLCIAAPGGSCNAGQCSKHLKPQRRRPERWKQVKTKAPWRHLYTCAATLCYVNIVYEQFKRIYYHFANACTSELHVVN